MSSWLKEQLDSHKLIVLAYRFRDLGFGDSDGMHGEPWGHVSQVHLESSLQVLVNLVWGWGTATWLKVGWSSGYKGHDLPNSPM